MKPTVKISWLAACLLLVSLFFAFNSEAQKRRVGKGTNFKLINAPTFEAKLGTSQFYGDIQQQGEMPLLAPMFGLAATNHFHSMFSGSFQVTAGQLRAERDFSAEVLGNESFRGSVVDVNLTLAFNILQFSLDRRSSFIRQDAITRYNAYVFAGFGWAFYQGKVNSSYDRINNQVVPFQAVRQTKGGSASQIPIGFGGRYRITKSWSCGFEYTLKRMGADNLDGTDTEWTEKNDWYSFAAVKAGYTILGKYRRRSSKRRTF